MSFATFPVTGTYQTTVPGGVLRGDVRFTSNLIPGSVAHGMTDTLSFGIIGAPVDAYLRNGVLVPTDDPTATVTLYSNDSQLALPFALVYTVCFRNLTVDGAPVTINPFTFNAPSDSTPVVLA